MADNRNISYTKRNFGQGLLNWFRTFTLNPFSTIGTAVNRASTRNSSWFDEAIGTGTGVATNAAQRLLDQELANNAIWNSLSDTEKQAVIANATSKAKRKGSGYETWGGATGSQKTIDIEQIIKDFNDSASIIGDYQADLRPPDYDEIDRNLLEQYYQPMYDRLDQEQADMREMYNNQLRMSNDMYNRNADMIMGNQMRQNAMIQDSLRSDISRTRQNALEAGASAGLRLAGNINATLSAQNKAAQTSLDTSNNLAQMLLNQRQAAAGLGANYQNYMSDSNRYRDSLQQDYLTRRGSERQMADQSYQNRMKNMEDSLTVRTDNSLAQPYAQRALQKNIYKPQTNNITGGT